MVISPLLLCQNYRCVPSCWGLLIFFADTSGSKDFIFGSQELDEVNSSGEVAYIVSLVDFEGKGFHFGSDGVVHKNPGNGFGGVDGKVGGKGVGENLNIHILLGLTAGDKTKKEQEYG